jgi:hypothetical protein
VAAGTAHAGAPPATGLLRASTDHLAAVGRATSVTRVEATLIVLALALAGATLLFPTTPTYDPWSWIVWGRQIVHHSLDTVEGPSWKPLPIFFTLPFSFFGEAAPNMWMVVARACGLLSLVAAFGVARRFVGGWAGIVGGLFATFALLTALDYVRVVALGNSEGMLVLVLLVAIDRHLRGRHRHAAWAPSPSSSGWRRSGGARATSSAPPTARRTRPRAPRSSRSTPTRSPPCSPAPRRPSTRPCSSGSSSPPWSG